MNIYRSLMCFVLLPATVLVPLESRGEKNAKVELIDPFDLWFATESLDFYVRVSNTGDESFPLAWLGRDNTDLFFETAPESRQKYGFPLDDLPNNFLPKVEDAVKPPGWGLMLPPGRAYVLNDADYNEGDFVFSECLSHVRVNLLLEKGRWVSSNWVERKILPAPDLSGKSLYDFVPGAVYGDHAIKVLPLKMGDETWLFSHYTGRPDRIGYRLCRVPAGSTVSAIRFDKETKRLTIRFDGGEESVVINTRTGLPVSGSERTVPHLHLWQKLAGRPFTDVYQQILERQQGKRDELDRSRSTVPAGNLNDATGSRSIKRRDSGDVSEPSQHSRDNSGGKPSQDATTNKKRTWLWPLVLAVLFGITLGVWRRIRIN